MPMAPPTRITDTANVPQVSNLAYPHGNKSSGGRRDIRHVASVTKSCGQSPTYTLLTPSKSDKLCPASANRLAEFIHSPANPFEIVSATFDPSPVISATLC